MAGAGNAARGLAVLEAGRSVAEAAPDPAFVPVGLKRHGLHRGFGPVHKGFASPRSFTGKRLGHGGVIVGKGLVDPRFFARTSFRPRGISIKERFVAPRQFPGTRLRDGDFIRKGLAGPRLFSSERFADGHFIITRRFVGPEFLRKRLEKGHLLIEKPSFRPQRFGGERFGGHRVIVTNGLVETKLFLGKRFGESGVLVSKGFAPEPIRSPTSGRFSRRQPLKGPAKPNVGTAGVLRPGRCSRPDACDQMSRIHGAGARAASQAELLGSSMFLARRVSSLLGVAISAFSPAYRPTAAGIFPVRFDDCRSSSPLACAIAKRFL